MRKLTLTLLLFVPLLSFSQNCDCKFNFEWAKNTFEENDAGFEYALNNKGKEVYTKHNSLFAKKVGGISNKKQCAKLINEWLTFFRKGHLGFYAKDTEEEILDNHESVDNIDHQKFEKYLSSKRSIDFEGIWKSDTYTVGVKKINGIYKGFVMQVSSGKWKPGEVKFYINPDSSGVYHMGDYSEYPFKKAELFEGQILNMNGIYFTKVFPKTEEINPNIQRYLRLINASNPSIEKVNEETCLLRIPSFRLNQKKAIDSLLDNHINEITSNRNLIIDLRGNGGGAGKSYDKLLPILYTDPIKTIYWEHLSTVLNNKRWEEWLQNSDLTEQNRKFLLGVSEKLNNNIGDFVYVYDNEGYELFEQDFQYKNPQNIALLVDENNASASEQFLLSANQSSKVKVFGRVTYGALDMSEVNQVVSPDGNFVLAYCLTKSLRLPDFPIDGIGIQPDYYLDKSVLPYNWIEFVLDVYKE